MKSEPLPRLLLGLATGSAFGFLLHKSGAADHEAITGQLRFTDSAVIKIMATASAVGAIGAHLLVQLGLAEKKVKPLNIGGVVLGGALFGAGMGIFGYCPGTSMAAIGAGHKDAAVGALGMMGGALAFVKLYPYIAPAIKKGEFGKQTLPEMTGTSPWLWVAGLATAVAAGKQISERASTSS